jgi:hypothetical protein
MYKQEESINGDNIEEEEKGKQHEQKEFVTSCSPCDNPSESQVTYGEVGWKYQALNRTLTFTFTFSCTVHNKLTRNRGNLHVLQSCLSIRQKGIHYMSVKIFNSLPKFLIDLLEDGTMFVERLKEILIHNAFYSVDEFLNYCQKKY